MINFQSNISENKATIEFISQIPDEGNIAIFGICSTTSKFIDLITKYRPKIKIVGYINSKKDNKTFNNCPIWSLKEFIDLHLDVDLIISCTAYNMEMATRIFKIHDYKILVPNTYVHSILRNEPYFLNEKKYLDIINMFETDEDKELYTFIYHLRQIKSDFKPIKKYVYKENELYDISKFQYIDRIIKNKVTTIIDAGFNDGINSLSFMRFFPNLKKIHAFEGIYEYCKNELIESFFDKNIIKLNKLLLGDKENTINFYLNKTHTGGSCAVDISSIKNQKITSNIENIKLKTTTIDKYCMENDVKPDMIKMDIEGAELSALKGGIKTIQKYRPQLAISIYHSNDDFINIPLYLKENLKNYTYRIKHYTYRSSETILYAIPKEII